MRVSFAFIRFGDDRLRLSRRPSLHHRGEFIVEPLPELKILGPRPGIAVRAQIVMAVMKDERIVHGPHELFLLHLTMHEMMPAEQRSLARFGLPDEKPVIVAFEIIVLIQTIRTITLMKPVLPDAPVDVLSHLRASEQRQAQRGICKEIERLQRTPMKMTLM